jgi:nodulation protein E
VNNGNRVVVTGCGVVSPIGQSTASFWSALLRGESGIAAPTLFPTQLVNQKVVAEVKEFTPLKHFDDRQLATLDRVSQFSVVAAREAIAQSGLSFANGVSERTATIIGSGAPGQVTQDESYKRLYGENANRIFPLTIPKLMANAPASQITMHCGLRGPAFVVASACASATHAIGVAYQMVKAGIVDCAVTGGAEACMTLGVIKGWEAMRVMAPDACRPFSKDRRGLVLAEGAGIVVLERLDHAQKRGATVLAELAGFGMSSDAKDLTNPDLLGMARAMQSAIDDAGLTTGQIQYVNAHGTGTFANDLAETAALKHVFGDKATSIAISSTKSMTGHALGAAGALEFVATVMAIRENVAPPTIGYLERDPDCDLDYVPNEARPMPISAAMSNSFAFGGLNAVLVAKKAA